MNSIMKRLFAILISIMMVSQTGAFAWANDELTIEDSQQAEIVQEEVVEQPPTQEQEEAELLTEDTQSITGTEETTVPAVNDDSVESYDVRINDQLSQPSQAKDALNAAAEESDPSEDIAEGNISWSLDEGVLTISGSGAMDDYEESSTWNSSSPWNSDRQNIVKVVIEDGITHIGDCSFYNCNNLTSIIIPSSVTSIGSLAFCSCKSLTSITIPESVTSIERSAFSGCSSLASITIPEGVTSISYGTFFDCSNLTDIAIPESVTSIDQYAFYGCSSLTSITIPDSVTSIGPSAFSLCSSLTSITISDSVTSIGVGAFSGCSSLAKITVPLLGDDFETIFSSGNTSLPQSLKSVVITGGEDIKANYFSYCRNLTDIIIPDSVISIGEQAFYGCSGLTNINIPDSVMSIGERAFYGCSSLPSITIPDSVTSVGNQAFLNCSSLTSIKIPYIGNSITQHTRISTIFSSDNLKEIIITGNITDIEANEFNGCRSLTSVTIPGSITSIGASAFYDCSSLTDINIPDSVISIGESAFNGCSSLTDITIPGSITSINRYAFYRCSGLTSITIPDIVTSIGEGAFSGCSSLTSITIPDGVTSIEQYTFKDCSSLTSITIPDGVTSIGKYTFNGCSSLTSVTIPDSVTSIGVNAFSNCPELKTAGPIGSGCNIEFGWKTDIPREVFNKCSSLTEITIPDSVTKIGNYAFAGCTSISSITIPDSVVSFESMSFDKGTTLIVSPKSRGEALAKTYKYKYDLTTGHTAVWTVISEPTCTESGYKSGHCSTCNIDIEAEEIPAKGHSWSEEYTIDKKPTIIEEGIKSIHCTECGSIKEGSERVVNRIHVENIRVEAIPDQTYTGRRIEPEVEVYLEESKLESGEDYTVTYSNNTNVGKAQVQLNFNERFGENYTLNAEFNIIWDSGTDPNTMGYQLSIDAKNPGKKRYKEGELVTVTALNSEYSVFSKWIIVSGDLSLTSSQLNSNPLKFTMPACDVVLRAVYTGQSLEEALAAENNRYNNVLRIISSLETNIEIYSGTINSIKNKYGENSLQSAAYYTNMAASTETTLTQKYNRLVLLQSNTSVSYQAEIKQLEAEIDELEADYQMYLELEYVARLQEKVDDAQYELDSIDLNEEERIHESNIANICQKHGVKDASIAEIEYILLDKDEYEYTGKPIYPLLTVLDSKGKELGRESYDIVYPSDCTTEGKHVIKLVLKGDYTGTKEKTFTIVKHRYGEWIITREASCTENGSREKVCKDCGKKIVEVIPAAHNYGEWTIVKEPTCTEKGSKTHTCNMCNHKEDIEISAKGHTWNSTYTVDKPATQTTDGLQSIHCSVCGEIKPGSSIVIAKLTPAEIVDLPAVKISKPAAAKKSVNVKWKKVSKKNQKKIQGIEIQVATDPDFTDIVKNATAGKKKTSKKIKGLASKQTYYVRIRAYSNAADGYHVSAWKTKKVKIR